ncbi:hypothetical protein DER45DRAFT_570232 [Fusarium avenaceum]|nr:hypothetical protein DER45DRAFT_570232 [Fusarium avenaceum]
MEKRGISLSFLFLILSFTIAKTSPLILNLLQRSCAASINVEPVPIERPSSRMVSATVLVGEALIDDILKGIPAHLLWHTRTLVLEMAVVLMGTVLAFAVPRTLTSQGTTKRLSVFVVVTSVSASANTAASYTVVVAICCAGHGDIQGHSQKGG